MILSSGDWNISGSWRSTETSTLIHFFGRCTVSEQNDGRYAIDSEITTETSLKFSMGVWIARTETGLYEVSLMGTQTDLSGLAKLDSLPHLALLTNQSGSNHLAATVFEAPEVFGIRGLYQIEDQKYSFEIAIKSNVDEIKGENIVRFLPRGYR